MPPKPPTATPPATATPTLAPKLPPFRSVARPSWCRHALQTSSLAVLALLLVPLSTCSRPSEPERSAVETTAPESEPPRVEIEWALAIHGGAGVIRRDDADTDDYYRSLEAAVSLGRDLLQEGAAAIEAVERVVQLLEDDPLFNAGRGAVYNDRGTHELDAAIMDGRTLSCGAVAAVRNIRNPISLARAVMERSPHVLLIGDGADRFAQEVRVRRVPNDYYSTERRLRQWQEARRRARQSPQTSGGDGVGTVGAVALDRYGNLAAATSTGGLTNKRYGRVGDVPIIGAGTYANNDSAAVSCTGKGEEFIRHTVARTVTSLVEYGGRTLGEAVAEVIDNRLATGDGGLIAVGKDGEIVMSFSTDGMFRGAADSSGRFEIGIWDELLPAPPGASAP